MLQHTKNKQTVEILRKLREQGAPSPEIGTVSLDMVQPVEEEGVSDQLAEELQPPKKKKARPSGPASPSGY